MGVYLGKIPVGIIIKTTQPGGNLKYCNVEQIIKGEACELVITESDEKTNYVIGLTEDDQHMCLYICDNK